MIISLHGELSHQKKHVTCARIKTLYMVSGHPSHIGSLSWIQYLYILYIYIWLVVDICTPLKNISQWEVEGLSHILWKNKCSKPPTRYLIPTKVDWWLIPFPGTWDFPTVPAYPTCWLLCTAWSRAVWPIWSLQFSDIWGLSSNKRWITCRGAMAGLKEPGCCYEKHPKTSNSENLKVVGIVLDLKISHHIKPQIPG